MTFTLSKKLALTVMVSALVGLPTMPTSLAQAQAPTPDART